MANSQNNPVQKTNLPYSINLEVTEPVREGEIWKVNAVATILFSGKYAPDPPVNVLFLSNKKEIGRVTTDKETGCAHLEFSIVETGAYIVHTAVVEMPGVTRSKQIVVKKDVKQKVPKSLEVTFVGERGKQTLFIAVGGEDGILIPNFTGSIIDGIEQKKFTTGENGTCKHEMDFHDPDRFVEVKAGNSPNLIWSEVLLGPKKTQVETQIKQTNYPTS
jgi:hypothetical protein